VTTITDVFRAMFCMPTRPQRNDASTPTAPQVPLPQSFPLQTLSETHRRGSVNGVQSQPVRAATLPSLNPESAILPSRTLSARHTDGTTVSIVRDAKAADQHRVSFRLTFKQPSGEPQTSRELLDVNDSDPNRGGASSLSVNVAELPTAAQGLGIGALCMLTAAQAGMELGVRYVAADTVVSEAGQMACVGLGMQDRFVMSSYELDPGTLLLNARQRAQAKGWTIDH
jgi:hypothetical protein